MSKNNTDHNIAHVAELVLLVRNEFWRKIALILGRMSENAHAERLLLFCLQLLFVTSVGFVLLITANRISQLLLNHTHTRTHACIHAHDLVDRNILASQSFPKRHKTLLSSRFDNNRNFKFRQRKHFCLTVWVDLLG